jgi:hypothetical protein
MVSRRVPLLALSLLVLAALAAPTGANHLQSESGRSVSFDHKAGNEWWVEVVLGGPDAASATRVEGMDTGGPWTALPKQSWGAYAASFHIEPGHQVRFRAFWADGDVVTSCWFAHPAGAEQCSAGPATWSTTEIGQAGSPVGHSPGDMAIGDADNDGRRDVAVATGEAAWLFEAGTSGWARETAYSMVDGTGTAALASGDGDGDGRSELYVLDGNELRVVARSPGAWDSGLVAGFVPNLAADVTLGDIDGVPGPEVYAAVYDYTNTCEFGSCTFASDVFEARWTGSAWQVDRILETATAVDSLWIGDGDRDGRAELYVGHSTMHADHVTQLKRVSGAWQATELPGIGAGAASAQVVVGDGDRDGKGEVYVADWEGHLFRDTFTSSGWTQEILVYNLQSPEGFEVSPTRLFLGDGDGDGSQELYLSSDQGEVYQVRWDGAAWQVARLAQPQDPFGRGTGFDTMLVVGDGDGDGRGEAYLTASFHMPNTGEDGVTRVYRVAVAGSTPPPGGFDATFSGVRGNEWWEQANVAATGGTLAKVEVRIGDGAWQPLAKQSWGGWAASYRAVDGTAVQFRATSTTGATDLSACYRWIPPSGADASQMACPGTPPPPSFDATFANAKGNEWWVQVQAAPNSGHTIAAVQARVDGGAWFGLDKQSWGPKDYAVSRHVPDGSKVQFQAIDQAGAADLSGCYQWIPPGGGLAASVAC